MAQEKRIIRIRLSDVDFRRYKVFCAIENLSMTDMTNRLIKDFLSQSDSEVKIVRIVKKE